MKKRTVFWLMVIVLVISAGVVFCGYYYYVVPERITVKTESHDLGYKEGIASMRKQKSDDSLTIANLKKEVAALKIKAESRIKVYYTWDQSFVGTHRYVRGKMVE